MIGAVTQWKSCVAALLLCRQHKTFYGGLYIITILAVGLLILCNNGQWRR